MRLYAFVPLCLYICIMEIANKENKTYVIFKSLSTSVRRFLILLFLIIGFALQTTSSSLLIIIAGTIVVFFASLLSLVRNISIKEKKARSSEWQKVTMEEFNKVKVKLKQIKKWSSISTSKKITMIIILFVLCWSFSYVLFADQPLLIKIIIIDAFILFIPLFVSGSRSIWTPPDMDIKVKALSLLLDFDFIKNDKRLKLQPYLQIGIDSPEKNFPTDAKLIIEITGAPKDFLGVQMQVSINRVQSKAYPYAYAVIVAQKSLHLDLKEIKSPDKKVVFEPKQQAEVDILVIRQRTSRTSGYHTNDSTIENIVRIAINTAFTLLNNEN
ncbi:MAG: hypothetical protein A2Y62_19460 [Candidatus Fischerbacteria bacterium RBG_13_37_8]|uniref:Uncharacterized protein n=1 Tax=Candidatus Fischerbacteria bacterium RBG_13_37_8 TaxID=1817863 RepID=A0A1F5VN24_9BACT|nr:MAG: hypothetical protein A2Y62_19460 [Candidatus Fischerbacteria bacterium RBG_13_37_8]